MRNNKTTANAPLRTSETVDVLTQQIMGTIKREGSGQFENVVPEEPVKPVKEKAAIEQCGCGEIGRRTRFRFSRRKACRFDSCHPHHKHYERIFPLYSTVHFRCHI
jgi:hypothetical protein